MNSQESRFERVRNILPRTPNIRNVTIVAHVDHGKTTLADCLLASNNVIHKKQAGQLRILDDRLDEQDRGITMKSSSISLIFQDHLINLIDSPGHLEFYSEVSSALRLTDSALLVVDVVEGVSSQTFRVLQQLYVQKLPAILVLNKIDKLVTQCKMDPQEAYTYLSQIIEQVNAILGSFISKEVEQKPLDKGAQQISDRHMEKLQDVFYFSPTKRNVIFGSALDNWGFAVEMFSSLIAKKINQEPKEIEKYLWGEHYYNAKAKQFSSEPRIEGEKPICVQWVLKPIWTIFEEVENKNIDKIDKIIASLKLKIPEAARKNCSFQLVKEILNAWLPFDRIVMERIVEVLPNPKEAQLFRLPHLIQLNSNATLPPPYILQALEKASHEVQLPLIVFVSKMVNIPKAQINEKGLNELKGEGDIRSIGFARIFSGRIKRGDDVFIISAIRKTKRNKGDLEEAPEIVKQRIDNLYVFNAQHLQGIEEAYAGNIVGFGNLEQHMFKSGTISTLKDCISFVPISSQTKSILKVSVSTPNIQDNPKLLEGLRRLNKSDPSVDVYVEATGDIILNTCGEVHLQKCVVDLEKIYCKVPVTTSDPIISFRETIIWDSLKEKKNEKYIMEAEQRQKDLRIKGERDKQKEEMRMDTELDEYEKLKQKAISDWDSHVEIYQAEDLTVEDTRYFLVNRDDEGEEKFNYKREKQFKKADHRNRGKLYRKQKFLNLSLKTNYYSLTTPNLQLTISVRAVSIQFEVAEYLEKNSETIKALFQQNQEEEGPEESILNQRLKFIQDFEFQLKEYNVDQAFGKLIRQHLVCFGPNGGGSNLLICLKLKEENSLFRKAVNSSLHKQHNEDLQLDGELLEVLEANKTSSSEVLTSIKLGFNLASSSGPLCHEPMMGVIFIVEQIKKSRPAELAEGIRESCLTEFLQNPPQEQGTIGKNQNNFGPLAGQIASTTKEVCLQAFLGGSPRLVQPMYLCQLHTAQQYYGSIYHELSKRRVQIISEDLHEFSNFFIIKAHLPMLESHNLCFDILDKTQGTVNAQLDFATWKIFLEDPFFTPFTEDQLEEQGLENIVPNAAGILLDKIRIKKGLAGIKKIVSAADKQRTLKKK